MKVFLFIILVIPIVSIGQLVPEDEAKVDSLEQIIYSSKHDTIRIQAMRILDNIIYLVDPQLDEKINRQIDSICLLNINENISDKERQQYLSFRAGALNNLGLIYQSRGEYKFALQQYETAVDIYKDINEGGDIANAYNNMGIVYSIQGDYDRAIENFSLALKIYEKNHDKGGVANYHQNIGVIYFDLGEHEKAIEQYNKVLAIETELGNDPGIARSLSNLGNVYSELGDFDVALYYFSNSLQILEKIGDLFGVSMALGNIGILYHSKGDISNSNAFFERSLKIQEEIGDLRGVAKTLNNIGDNFKDQGELNEALNYCKRSLAISKEIGLLSEVSNASNVLAEIYKELGEYKLSLEMKELFVTSRDSLKSEENQKELIRQEYKYHYEKQAATDSVKASEEAKVQEAEIARQEAEIEAKEKEQYMLYGGLGLVALFSLFIFNRFRVTSKQKSVIEEQKSEVEKQKDIADQQKEEAERQKELVEEKNQEIMDSINYAKRIQSAILPPNKLVKEYLHQSFILYKPKDVVAGDFYWMEHVNGKVLFAAADCTGHGVPGAMVSVVCNNGLNRSVREYGLTDPGKILDKTREIVIQEFEKSEEEVKDGMDIALCSLELLVPGSELRTQNSQSGTREPGTAAKLQFAGAHNPLWIIRKGAEEVEEIKATKEPIGKFDHPNPYTTHTVELSEGDTIYIFSDGYADQFGGENLPAGKAGGKKFKTANFKRLLLSIQHEPMERQRELIDEAFENWRGEIEQIDDVCVIGVRV